MSPFTPEKTRLVVVLVGLPARGKTHIGRKVARYLNWLGFATRAFNIGDYRRTRLGRHHRHDFFNPTNEEGNRLRNELAALALEDLVTWMRGGGQVGIYDATNTTAARRRQVFDRCSQVGLDVVFVESVCEDPAIIESNIRETKLTSPDYEGVDPDEAARDFRARIDHYTRAYEPVHEENYSYIKLIDVGRVIVMHQIQGYVTGKLVHFLMNMHLVRRPIWLTRHGESEFNVQGRIGGDSPLTPNGRNYARALASFVREHAIRPPTVWTSTLRRTVETARELHLPFMPWRALDEIDGGLCDAMTYAEIAERMPEEYAARQADKLNYRYPRGESYVDVTQRLEPVILELEREREPVLVVGHQAVLRVLYAYFTDRRPEQVLHLDVPIHTVIELTPGPYAFTERRFALEPSGSGTSDIGDAMRD
ncbi:MAG: 6-phosphofructo-2-kinase/fructose-2,6-bisphosphatase [Deltaproteobacteria bacterium]|nr:6-phosphofructo-2-kinase/fructose-2,6-bisphosphatase [Deltaproteobacteria bacterium]